ncbi:hypothetical protein VT84_37510 [Gemmata sp. SH-PL17]|uniref:ribonuclease HI family protein n=1 Tax=Gemmata sp. SH-PL17 TaxID=1630693 RepID=UPI00078E0AAE|nr:ribonuclease HI family protein [Gemmata sp. SH-PL17]AMV30151.1 hypothetical protein VT84_37510 [Gemmata sp. SH-PL17]
MDLGIFFDGLCEPINPGGTACYGYAIYGIGPVGKAVPGCGVFKAGAGMTNNVAEWIALGKALALVRAEKLRPDTVTIYGDSQLVINQLIGDFECNNERLREYRDRCLEHLTELACVWKAHWIPREQNVEADHLARAAYVGRIGRLLPERVKA